MRHGALVFPAVYSPRLAAVQALRATENVAAADGTKLRDAASELDHAAKLYGRAECASEYGALAELLRIIALLVEWRKAVLNAEPDSERFLRGAKERYKGWEASPAQSAPAKVLTRAGGAINSMSGVGEVATLCAAVADAPLPFELYSEPQLPFANATQDDTGEAPSELAVAFLRFSVNGVPASAVHFLQPGETHDLEVEVKVSRWPDNATTMLLMPVSIEARSTFEFPQFRFTRPTGDPPFVLQQRGRAILHTAQSLSARPYEFKYAASFEPTSAEQPVAVVGHRTLIIEGYDLRLSPITGYVAIDRKILSIRDQLRKQPAIPQQEIRDTLTILRPLCALAGRALQDALFRESIDEAQFQREIRNELRREPTIGSELEEHSMAAGGFTDLSFHGIRIELKVDDSHRLVLADCKKYIGQIASYVAGTGKRIGVLCVLDCSPKRVAPFPADDGIDVFGSPASGVFIVTVLVQGNLARPSDLSRSPHGPP
jgi:hypothetical protein